MSDSIADQFKGLPMQALIGAPLNAACQAQFQLASTMVNFINQIGFDGTKTRTIDFDLERPVDNGTGVIQKETVTVHAPLLGLVPIPALLIETVDINFSMEVSSHSETKTVSAAEAAFKASGSWFCSYEVSGKVSTSRENTRSTDNTAKYVVSVIARQQAPQEGMSKLMDLMASAVEPIALASA